MTKYEETLKVLVFDLGFEPIGDYYDTYKRLKTILFEKIENESIRRVELNDYREDEDTKDWYVWSYWKDEETDYLGHKIDAPCPMTAKETKAFLYLIEEFEKLNLN